MKTTNNYQKTENWGTIRKSLLAVVGLTLISFYLIAPDFFNHLSDNEVVEAETSLQTEDLTNIIKYNSEKFVESEMKLEIVSWLNRTAETERLSPYTWYSEPNRSFFLKTYFN